MDVLCGCVDVLRAGTCVHTSLEARDSYWVCFLIALCFETGPLTEFTVLARHTSASGSLCLPYAGLGFLTQFLTLAEEALYQLSYLSLINLCF